MNENLHSDDLLFRHLDKIIDKVATIFWKTRLINSCSLYQKIHPQEIFLVFFHFVCPYIKSNIKQLSFGIFNQLEFI